jgi:cytochrome c
MGRGRFAAADAASASVRSRGTVGMLSAAVLLASAGAGVAGDAARGEAIYHSTCMACHSLDKNGIGPMHRDVFGRKAGAVEGYDYSAALKSSGIVWNGEALEKWLTNPQAFVPGNKMFYRVADPEQRVDVIEFLKEKTGG